jgi:glycerophosphoryl diester phosphodiesterase
VGGCRGGIPLVSDWLRAKSTLIIGHRGASADAPENSLTAFALAAEQGADGIEIDVQLSADGWPVLMHDERVDRTTNGSGAVAELTFEQCQALDCGDGGPIPSLDQVFETFGPAFLYNVELKGAVWQDDGLVSAVADRIESHQLEEKVLVSTFNPRILRRCRSQMSRRIAIALLRAPGPYKYTYLIADGQADHPHHSMIDKKYMEWAQNRDYRVHTWTVDDPSEAQRLVDLGVHGIITNKPAFLRKNLQITSQ